MMYKVIYYINRFFFSLFLFYPLPKEILLKIEIGRKQKTSPQAQSRRRPGPKNHLIIRVSNCMSFGFKIIKINISLCKFSISLRHCKNSACACENLFVRFICLNNEDQGFSRLKVVNIVILGKYLISAIFHIVAVLWLDNTKCLEYMWGIWIRVCQKEIWRTNSVLTAFFAGKFLFFLDHDKLFSQFYFFPQLFIILLTGFNLGISLGLVAKLCYNNI